MNKSLMIMIGLVLFVILLYNKENILTGLPVGSSPSKIVISGQTYYYIGCDWTDAGGNPTPASSSFTGTDTKTHSKCGHCDDDLGTHKTDALNGALAKCAGVHNFCPPGCAKGFLGKPTKGGTCTSGGTCLSPTSGASAAYNVVTGMGTSAGNIIYQSAWGKCVVDCVKKK